ncbi:TrmH family RNA methyltransferase [Cnuella takakiae]|uniref:TrmH family RNA methyltransferase n=1 Tax=Cnuella takakiae TaxID=1302690 RepID=UPI001FEAD86C|nr:RNA methyltransferase [Cnuella takakiae]
MLAHRQPDFTVVLENVFDVHNVSAIMRTCDAIGIQEIFVINDREPPPGRWGFRSSGGAYKWITAHQFTDVQSCMSVVRSRYQQVFTTHLSSDVVSLYEMNLTGSIALVFGNEQKGVSETLRGMADGNFIIPQMGMIRSLNISVACAIALYEGYRQKAAAGHYDMPKLPPTQIDQLRSDWYAYSAE